MLDDTRLKDSGLLEILDRWNEIYKSNKIYSMDNQLRLGQSLMCAIHDKNTQFYSHISGTEFDCFYLDSVIPKTLLKLEESMEV